MEGDTNVFLIHVDVIGSVTNSEGWDVGYGYKCISPASRSPDEGLGHKCFSAEKGMWVLAMAMC